MGILLFPVVIVLGVLQIGAGMVGLEYMTGWPYLLCVAIAGTLAFMRAPLIPTILGIYGAHYAWGWEWWQAVALFFGLTILLMVVGGVGAAFGSIFSRKTPA